MKKLWTRLWTTLRDFLWNNAKESAYLKSSHVLLTKRCSSLQQNISHHSGGAWRNSDTELKFLTIKPFHQKQSPGSVLLKKCSQKLGKTYCRKPVSDSDTRAFLSILQNFQEHFSYWTPSVVASSKFKASGFREEEMQMNFWITHDLAHLSTFRSSSHFCVYFRQAEAFRCIPSTSLILDILNFFDKEG